jgi:hypothetical protein
VNTSNPNDILDTDKNGGDSDEGPETIDTIDDNTNDVNDDQEPIDMLDEDTNDCAESLDTVDESANDSPVDPDQLDTIEGPTAPIVDTIALITIQIFLPICDLNSSEMRRMFSVKEFVVLSNQFLTSLRDAFRCVSDIISPMDCSHKPDIHASLNQADHYTSGFMYINEVFYNDMRLAANFDYSE